jgi:hypothetical protein
MFMLESTLRDRFARLKSEGSRRGVATPFFMQYRRHVAAISSVANHATAWLIIVGNNLPCSRSLCQLPRSLDAGNLHRQAGTSTFEKVRVC